MPEFNLLDEPWILVTKQDGSKQQQSLLEVFQNAHLIKRISGETETQNVSILRLCLSILHTVVRRYDINGNKLIVKDKYDAIDRWAEWWEMKQFPIEIITDYLENWRDHFYLFSEDHPFYQDSVVGMELKADYKKVTDRNSIQKVANNYLSCGKLVGYLSESGNKKRLFRAENQQSISYAEAARWLVNFMNVDDKSIKKPTPKVCGSLGEIGCVYAEEDTLYETLMFNLTMDKLQGDDEIPCWEGSQRIGENHIQPIIGLAQWYTLQVRRVYLDHKNGRVIGFKAKAGDCFNEVPLFEPMTSWKKEKKGGVAQISPRKHRSEIAFWRNLSLLLTESEENGRPGIIDWLVELKAEGYIDSDKYLTFSTVGLEYGTMISSIKNSFSDSVGMAAILLEDKSEAQRLCVLQQIDITKEFANRFAELSEDVFLASGGDEGENRSSITNVRNKAKGDFYAAVDLPFRIWLSKVGKECNTIQEIETSWWEIVSMESRKLCDQLMRDIPETSVFGRKGRSAAKAYNKYLYNTYNVERVLGGREKKK